jgi:ABC-type Fe3+-siderophore transport system permease subunit
MKRGVKYIVFLGAGFTYMVLLIEAIRAAVAWWQGELAQPGWGDIALIALLPLLGLDLVALHLALRPHRLRQMRTTARTRQHPQ